MGLAPCRTNHISKGAWGHPLKGLVLYSYVWHKNAGMRGDTKVQLGLALIGVPLLLFVWKGDSKWPNPLALDKPKP